MGGVSSDSHSVGESLVTMEFIPTGTDNVVLPYDRDHGSLRGEHGICRSDHSSSIANANDPVNQLHGDTSGVTCWKPLVPLKPPWFYRPPDGF